VRVYGASRPYPGQSENGDSWVALEVSSGLRLAVVDGAGHGPEAAIASQRAIEVITDLASATLTESLTQCHEALKGTRGAVLSLVNIRDRQLEFLGVGNVQGRLSQSSGAKSWQLAPDRGLLGTALPHLHPQIFELSENWALLLCSDGISERSIRGFGVETLVEPQNVVDEVLRAGGRKTDDATAVLVIP